MASSSVALSKADRQQDQSVALASLPFPATQPQLVYLRSVRQTVLVMGQIFRSQDGSQGAF